MRAISVGPSLSMAHTIALIVLCPPSPRPRACFRKTRMLTTKWSSEPTTNDTSLKDLLIDEINRNTPKTNSAVIEAMQERQATIEAETIDVPYPFMVIAAQSPIEFQGVFPLPEVVVDRFLLRLGVGYPSASEEIQLTDRAYLLDSRKAKQAASAEQISYLSELARNGYIAPKCNPTSSI